MITLRLEKDYSIPTRWDELTPMNRDQFVCLASALGSFEQGKDDFNELRCKTAFALLGMDLSKIKDFTPEFEENIFRITEVVTFPWRLEEQDGKTVCSIDIILKQQLLPKLRGHVGYTFIVSPGGMVDCSLTAEQYIDAVQLMQVYARTFSRESLEKLCDVLYGEGAGSDFRPDERLAVYYNLRGILEWIKLLPEYALVFSGSSRRSAAPASPLGLSGSIFQLAKAGYGSIEDIKKLDLFSYLGILVQMTTDSILAMKAQNIKPVDAAEKLGLAVELVTPYYEDARI